MKGFNTYRFLIWFTVICAVGTAGFTVPYPWQESTSQIRLYTPDEQLRKTWKGEDLTSGVVIFQDASYNPNKPTMLIAHGWFQDADDEIIKMIVDSLFEVKFYEKMNIMVLHVPYFLDSVISNISYFSLRNSLEALGNIVAEILNNAIERKLLKPENLNMVGLSLGAQLSGYISRMVHGEVHSILGLDPAGPGFDKSSLQYVSPRAMFQHVSKTDARFVHLYHTNSVTFGTYQRLGTADFEFNEGIIQPGCINYIDLICSHKRAFYIFNDLIQGDKELIALRCDSYKDFNGCRCRGNATVVLRYPFDTSAEGVHFLKTKSKAPFGLGEEGITCWKDQWDKLQKEKEQEKSKAASAMMEITEKFKSTMELIKKRETSLLVGNVEAKQ